MNVFNIQYESIFCFLKTVLPWASRSSRLPCSGGIAYLKFTIHKVKIKTIWLLTNKRKVADLRWWWNIQNGRGVNMGRDLILHYFTFQWERLCYTNKIKHFNSHATLKKEHCNACLKCYHTYYITGMTHTKLRTFMHH